MSTLPANLGYIEYSLTCGRHTGWWIQHSPRTQLHTYMYIRNCQQ